MKYGSAIVLTIVNIIHLQCFDNFPCDHPHFLPKDRYSHHRTLRSLQNSTNFTVNPQALLQNSQNFKPIRIKAFHLDSKFLNTSFWYPEYIINATSVSIEYSMIFEKNILNPVIQFYSQVLTVYPVNDKIFLNDSYCPYILPDEYAEGISDYDLVIAYLFEYSMDEFRARACPCQIQEKYNNRPLTGILVINSRQIDPNYQLQNEDDPTFKLLFSTFAHELVHIFGFTPDLYDLYISPDGKALQARREVPNSLILFEKTVNQDYLIVEPLKSYARSYFDCPALEGMPLEMRGSNGTLGAHFSRSAIFNDLMTGSSIYDRRAISNFTLKFLESTGWYHVNYTYAERTIWGKGKGCDFLTPKCEKYSEYCSQNGSVYCDYHNNFVSVCVNDGLSYCQYYYGFQSCDSIFNLNMTYAEVNTKYMAKQPFQTYGDSSKCVISSYDTDSYVPSCMKMYCNLRNLSEENSTGSVTIEVHDPMAESYLNITCPEGKANEIKNVQLSNGKMITLYCPYYERVCYNEDSSVSMVHDILASSVPKINSLTIFLLLIFINLI